MRGFAFLSAAALALTSCTAGTDAEDEAADVEYSLERPEPEESGAAGGLVDMVGGLDGSSAEGEEDAPSLSRDSVQGALDGPGYSLGGSPPERTTYRAPFDEFLERNRAEIEVSSETYKSVGRPYGCTEDCSGHQAGFEYRAKHGYGGRIAGDYDARSFRQGQQAYDDEVERRVEEARQEYEMESGDEF